MKIRQRHWKRSEEQRHMLMIADNPESLAYYWIILNGLYLHRWLTVLGKFRELTYSYGYNVRFRS